MNRLNKTALFTLGGLIFLFTTAAVSGAVIRLPGGTLHLRNHRQGRLFGSGILTRAAAYRSGRIRLVLKAGTRVHYQRRYNYVSSATLGRPARIKVGRYTLRLQAGTAVSFAKSGRTPAYISRASLARPMPVVINGRRILIKSAIHWHSNGKLHKVTLARHSKIKRGRYDLWYAANTVLELDRREQPVSGILRLNTRLTIMGKQFQVHGAGRIRESIRFHSNGTISRIFTARDFPIEIRRNRFTVKGSTLLTFHPTGAVAGLTVAANSRTEKGTVEAGGSVFFDRNGSVIRIRNRRPNRPNRPNRPRGRR